MNDEYRSLVGFEDIRTQETEQVRRANAHSASLRAQMAICESVASLASDSRFVIFGQKLAEMRGIAMRELILATDPGRLNQIQGAVQAFDKILSIIQANDNERKQLALALKEAENQNQALVANGGKVNPAGALWGPKANDDGRSQQRIDGRGDAPHGQVPGSKHRPQRR